MWFLKCSLNLVSAIPKYFLFDLLGSWNWVHSVIHRTLKDGVCKLCLTEKLWLLKHFNNKYFLNKKLELSRQCRHENKLLVKSAEKVKFYLYLNCCIILVFIAKYFVFHFQETRKRYLKIVERNDSEQYHETKLSIFILQQITQYFTQLLE